MSIHLRRLAQITAFVAIVSLCGFSAASAETPCEPLASDKGQLSFTAHTETAGTYSLWLRMVEPAVDRNSLFVQVDGGCPIVVGDGPAAEGLAWVSYAAGETTKLLTFDLAAGDHTITFAGREAKTGLDKFMLVNDQTCVPSGEGISCPSESSAPKPGSSAATIAQKSWLILTLCALIGLSALGFLLWKYFYFTKNTPAPLASDGSHVVAGQLGGQTPWEKLREFVVQHRLVVMICTAILLTATIVGIVFGAANSTSFEAESGAVSGGAQITENASASNGKYVLFDVNPVNSPSPGTSKSPSTSAGGQNTNTGSQTGGGNSGGGSGGGGTPPSGCQTFPNSSCTGYAHTGVTLKACSLPLVDPTYDSCLFTGEVNVSASNIVVTRSKIVGIVNYRSGDSGSLRGLSLTDVEIDSSGWDQASIGNNDYTCTRCDIHGGQRGANLGSNVTVQNSYLHGWYYTPGDHITGLSGHGGSNNTVKNNNISCDITNDPGGAGCSAGMSVYGDDPPGNDNWTITGNLFNSGSSYCVAIVGTPSKPYPFTNIVFTNNTFGSVGAAYWGVSASQCTEYGPINTESSSWGVNGNTWSGNKNSQGGTVNL